MNITIDPEGNYLKGNYLKDIELRSDEMLVMMGGQPFRIPRELGDHLYQVVFALVFAKSS